MSEEVWLEYLKENNIELYNEAKKHINKQLAIIVKNKAELQASELMVDRYRNLISSNYIFDAK
jgi:small nuclear ribonucleoprotein (snRNP)-like protein